MEGVESFQSKHARVGNPSASALAVKETDALQHALNPKEVAARNLLRATREKLAFPATDLNLKRTREIEIQRTTRIGDADYAQSFSSA